MNKKIRNFLVLLSSALSITFLSGCNKGEDTPKYLGDISYSFSNQEAIFNFKATGYKEFVLYEFDEESDEFIFIKNINKNSFSSNKLKTKFKVVPLENNQKVLDASLIIPSYFEGVFAENRHIKVFTSDDDHQEIQKYIDDKYSILSIDEWNLDRVEAIFLPGNYSDITLKNGYYTTFIGAGYSPDDVTFKKLETVNHPNTGNALINFWRSLENLSFSEVSMWAISQATSIRRGHFKGDLFLSDTTGGNGWSSGGFIANSKIDGTINPGSQQQFLMRNDTFDNWTHSNMNMVFEGCIGEIPSEEWLVNRTTSKEYSLDVIEKPYLVFDEEKGFGYMIFNDITDYKGHNWDNQKGEFIPISEFSIVHPRNTAKEINEILKNNKYVLFTPGIYQIDETLEVNNDDSIILGMGYATLSAVNDVKTIMKVRSANNKICSILFQSEGKTENYLFLENNKENTAHALLSDLFFRVGGHTQNNVNVDTCLVIDQDNVLCDHFWIWRADHGKNIGYYKNYAKYGCVINGQNVTCHSLMIEHFYKYQLIWNGENGEVIFYQSETPYDLPNQSYWMRYDEGYTGEEAFGYPSYKINKQVNNHKAYGLGIYYINTSGIYEKCYTGLETPYNDEIYLEHISARYFGGEGKFMYAVNNIKGYEEGLNLIVEYFNKDTYPELFQN